MSGFFTVTDLPARRVVQYKRVSGSVDGAVHIDDESVLGVAVDVMPYADKTGISISAGGTLFEVPYLADAGDVYIDGQPADGVVGDLLSVSARAGKEPYAYQWYKDGQMVVSVSTPDYSIKADKPGKYFAKVTDADGVEAVSKEAEVK